MKIFDYAIPDEEKKQLGYIIREIRKIKFQEYKNRTLIENNPYTKENFCENNTICHYHTLTKLESGDTAKEDLVYHTLLDKLELYFQVGINEHMRNMEFINDIAKDMLISIEYIDDELLISIKQRLEKVNFEKDCIALMYLDVINFAYNTQLVKQIDESIIDKMERFSDFYNDVYKGIVNLLLGNYFLNNSQYDKSKLYLYNSKKFFEANNYSKGIVNAYLIGLHKMTFNYLDIVSICNEMEIYYNETNNYKRLIHVYNYLSDYYFLINAIDYAEEYFKKTIDIINNHKGLERYKFILNFNWGIRCFANYRIEEALQYLLDAYQNCNNPNLYLQNINLLLIMLTKLQKPYALIIKYLEVGKKYYENINEPDQMLFKYFTFKYEKNGYHRRYALEKLIPKLSNNRNNNEILLFIYEDLYKKL
ncbi:MAG: hypothetical protein K0Q49_709 [Haloplasmataceae bacterium]|jgi:hypothetical protein|nr:hypothetical protein [Haloplasmataceae bacterium]